MIHLCFIIAKFRHTANLIHVKQVARIIFCSLLGFIFSGATAISAQNNQSRVTVFFKVKNGWLIVDRTKSRGKFSPSPLFCETLKVPADKCQPGNLFINVENDIFDDLDDLFKQMPDAYQSTGRPKIYQFALSADEANLDVNNQLKDALPKDVSSFSGDWEDFVKNHFDKWQAARNNRSDMGLVFTKILNQMQNGLENTPLIFFDVDDEGATNYDAGSGFVNYSATDPISDWHSKADYKICFPPLSTVPCSGDEMDPDAAVIRKMLSGLKSNLWRPGAMRARILPYYAQQGLLPEVNFNQPNDAKFINIQKSSRLARILFPAACLDDSKLASCDDSTTIEKLLYLLLPDGDFRYFIAQNPTKHLLKQIVITLPQEPDAATESPAEPLKFRAVDYSELAIGRHLGDEPLLNQFTLQDQQSQLAQQNFVVTLLPNGEDARKEKSYVDLSIVKKTDSKNASTKLPDNAPKPSAVVPDQHGVLAPQEGKQSPFVPETPKITPPPKSRPKKENKPNSSNNAADTASSGARAISNQDSAPKERNNYLGAGFDYKPGQGIRFFGLGQRSHLGPGNLSVQVGGNGGALYSANYFADFALFGSLHRRLQLQFTGSADYESNRVFNGVKTDDQRKGGLARAELELFRDLKGQLLRVSVEGRRSTVELKQKDKTVDKQNLSLLDLASYYLLQQTQSVSGRRLSLEPRLRFGLGLAASEAKFTAFALKGNYHQRLQQLFEMDMSGRIEMASKDTPIFEQPSFGGEDGVRGFRRDDAIGRRLWAIQPELWTPVPGTSNILGGPDNFLHSKVRLAGFFDVGGVYQTNTSKSGTRSGPGIGIRIIYQPIVMKLDWAYGIGEGNTGGGHGRFYFSISFNRPL